MYGNWNVEEPDGSIEAGDADENSTLRPSGLINTMRYRPNDVAYALLGNALLANWNDGLTNEVARSMSAGSNGAGSPFFMSDADNAGYFPVLATRTTSDNSLMGLGAHNQDPYANFSAQPGFMALPCATAMPFAEALGGEAIGADILGSNPVGWVAAAGLGGYALGTWINDNWLTDHQPPPPLPMAYGPMPPRTPAQDEQASVEAKAYKNTCDQPDPPSGDACQDILNDANRAQKCAQSRQAWDDKWWPNRHEDQIAQKWREWKNNMQDYGKCKVDEWKAGS
ncbi:MAG: hypothetical protein JO002_01470 [Burkholderiaceae bacterium]|nr:hypothetical protein [Burkholderiaceae bacterium]